MIRDQYSYWLTIKHANQKPTPEQTKALLEDLKQSSLTPPNGPMVFTTINNDTEIQGEVIYGTIEEDTELKTTIMQLSCTWPNYEFTFEEINEDDHSMGCMTTFIAGNVTYEGYKRTLEPNELDMATVKTIVDYLKDHDAPTVAKIIETKFLK